ncbi:aminotransferase class IV [Proteiniclasticum sp.]|uniref:aminotransferase class IV n=1 Tax=Proteiniclasticum sp. TaxID=2053595 RepID=UPI00289DF39F|nr:aminotransferase class IV [Proteiniclasticum sp.]
MDKLTGKYFMKNGMLFEAEDFNYKLNARNVYEVIRIIEGIPLFLEEHLERMTDSLHLLKMEMSKSQEEIRNLIQLMVKKNRIKTGNLKILINDGHVPEIFIYFIPHFYPDKTYYKNGIKTMTLDLERKNPNAKVIDATYKERVTRFIDENRIYEALIVNREGEITEGSKSNVFFIIENSLYTPPLKDVLGGVTRKRVLSIAKELGVTVYETSVRLENLKTVDAAFISGTSPKILPISAIDQYTYESSRHPLVLMLTAAYDQKITTYIETNQPV